MPAGRPSDYNEQTIPKTLEYLKNYRDYGDEIPSIAGLSVVLDVARNTIYDWASQEDKKIFSDILQDILSSQEKLLLNKGLSSEFNSNIVKLALGKHGYKERSDLTSDDKVIPILANAIQHNDSNKQDTPTE